MKCNLHRRFATLGLAALGFGALASLSMTSIASAHHSGCRTDPIIYLSNGTQFNMVINISDDSSDVNKVTYAVHGPSGTTVTKIVYTGNAFAGKEFFTYTANEKTGHFDTYTAVYTGAASMSVTATTSVQGGKSASASGHSNQQLLVHL